MNSTRRVSVMTGIALAFTAISFAQQIRTDYDRNVEFSHYKTFSWENVQTKNPLWIGRIKAAIASALSARGWTQVQSDGDASIMAMEMNQTHQTLHTYYDNFGGGWGGGFGESTTTEDNYRVGTLVVDLFDTKTKKLIWRGSASDILSNKPDRNIEILDKGVTKMFDHFPPELQKAER